MGQRGGATATRPPVSPFLPVHSFRYASSAEQKDGGILDC